MLHAQLSKEEVISLSGSQSEENFREALIDFAGSIDKNTNFLLKGSSDYCGAPPSSVPFAPTRCNIAAITQYYEIIDPGTCTFRYLNPPGCPGNPRVVQPNAANATGNRAKCIMVADQNWVGTARCQSVAAIYYGKQASASACESMCKSDRECSYWTFNSNNGYMPNSIHECWGGTAGLSPTRQKWEGFQSGGFAAAP
jgi:hypothetical protein